MILRKQNTEFLSSVYNQDPKARSEQTTLPSGTHTQGSHIFAHVERMETFSQLTGFIMMETCMLIYLGCCCYKRLEGEIYSRNVYRNCQSESGGHCVCCGSPADRVQPCAVPSLSCSSIRSVRNGLVVLKRSNPAREGDFPGRVTPAFGGGYST